MALVQLNLLGATGAGGEHAPFYLDSGSEGYDNEFATGGLGPVCDLTFLSAEALLGEEQESYSVYQGTVVVSAYEKGGTMIAAPRVFAAPIAVNRDPAATDQNAQVELEEGEPPSYVPGYLDTLVIERARDGNDF